MTKLLKPARLEPMLRNKRSHRSEKPTHRNEEQPPLTTTRESPRSNEDPMQPQKFLKIKINKFLKLKEKKVRWLEAVVVEVRL